MPSFPNLAQGLLSGGKEAGLVGTTFPQREVTFGGRSGWIDDMVGTGFRVVGLDADPTSALNSGQFTFLTRIDARIIVLSEAGDGGTVRDDTGFYREWMARQGIRALIVRPDHYIFGVAEANEGLGRVVDELRQQLSPQSAEPALANAHD